MAVASHILDAYLTAMGSPTPVETLRAVVEEELRNGNSRERVVEDLEQLREFLREAGRDRDDDLVLDVIGMVIGWCGPHEAI